MAQKSVELHLVQIEEGIKSDVLLRLKRVEGQIKGLQKMVAEGRYCIEVLTQISSVQEALRGLGRLVIQNYLENCVTTALRSGDREQADRIYRELMDVIYKYAK